MIKHAMWFALILTASAFAKEALPKLQNFTLNVKGVGLVNVKHEDVGEPIVQPERLQVFVTCEKSKKTILIRKFRMCKFESHTYEDGIKTLTLRLVAGRVETKSGKVVCDQVDDKNIDLSAVCN